MWEKIPWLQCVLLILMCLMPSFQAKKKIDRSSIIEINDVKPFKKLQKTHTNLLVMFAQSERDASGRFELLAQVAEEVKGQGTVAYINCGENKKLCKKLKVSPQPVVLKHYKDGKFNKDYDRKNTVKSMLKFFKDPTGDMPWEEEDGTEDVYHVNTNKEFEKLIKKEKKPVMVMFYAPWCGYCKKLKPDYALAATDLKREAVMAGMDVDTIEGYAIRREFNITGFPTLIYFESGTEKYRYRGKYDRDSIVDWMRNPAPPAPTPKEEEWSDTPSDVVHLKDENFDDFIANNPSVLVMFYAPWCGHCKAMKPEYVEAAKTLKEEEISGVLAAVDATKETAVGEKYKIEGYPTVKYFKDGEYVFDVNERTGAKIVEFMKDPKEPPPPPPAEKDWSEVESKVNHLTDDTFKGFLKKKKHVLVMFYAPWCGHCKKAKPEFMDAAEHDEKNTKVAYAAVDCTVQTAVCNQYDVHGYPTIRYFNYGKKDFKYTGGRTAKDFIRFMEDPREGPPPPPREPEWKDVPSHVNHLTDKTFEDFMETHDSVLVMFYAPWCGHCKAMKPAYMDAAEELNARNARSVLAAVDCIKEKSLAEKHDIEGYPTIKYFRKGKFASEYEKARTKEDLVEFLLKFEDTKAAETKSEMPEKPVEPAWSEEDSDVVHLTADTFKEFIQTHTSALVMFYAPWCPHCKKIKPEFSQVAKEVNTEKKVAGGLGAMDCTAEKDLCAELEIKGYPTLKYYKDGEFAFKYTKKRKAEDMLDFMKNPQKPAPPAPPPDWSKEPGKVHFLTNETFDSFMSGQSAVLVMFFTPRCGYCSSMKADYFKAAEILSEEHESFVLAAVDCARYRGLGKEHGVKGYPTVKYFKYGKFYRDYDGDRSVGDLISFMKRVSVLDKASDEEKPEPKDEQRTESEGLKILTSETFDSFLAETEHVIVMFYAPWCGHCQNAKPKFVKASEAFAGEPGKVFTAVDCTKDSALCDKQSVNGYPTIKYYRYGAFVVEYDGARTEQDFVVFMKSPPVPLPPDKPETATGDSQPPLPPDESGTDSKRDEL